MMYNDNSLDPSGVIFDIDSENENNDYNELASQRQQSSKVCISANIDDITSHAVLVWNHPITILPITKHALTTHILVDTKRVYI